MKKLLLLAAASVAVPSAAHATGGMVCRTANPRPVEVAVSFGHVAGSPLIGARLTDNARGVAVRHAQWWLDERELRLVLTDPNATRRELILKATRNGRVYDGNLWRGGQRRWVRCREG